MTAEDIEMGSPTGGFGSDKAAVVKKSGKKSGVGAVINEMCGLGQSLDRLEMTVNELEEKFSMVLHEPPPPGEEDRAERVTLNVELAEWILKCHEKVDRMEQYIREILTRSEVGK